MAKTHRKFTDVVALLKERGTNKQATAPTVPSVPEKDPNEKGVVSIPSDPDGKPAKQNTPESSTNKDETPVLKSPAPAKTVAGEEPAAINMKIANMTAAIQSFRAGVKKAMDDKALGENVPSNAQGNVNTPPAPGPTAAPKADSRQGDKGGKAAEAETKGCEGAKDPTEKPAPEPKTPGPTDLPTGEVTNTDTKVAAAPTAPAPEADAAVEFTPEFHFKLATEILNTEEGRAFALDVMQRSLGAEQAENIIKAAAIMEAEAQTMAEFEASGEAEAQAIWQQATDEQKEEIVKLATVHGFAKEELKDEFLKQAYDMGAAAASEALDEEGAGAPPEGATPPEGAPAEGEVSEQDILAVLEALVQS